MDFDYWDRNMAPQQTRTSFTVFASPDHQQLLNGGVSLDDQEELDSIRSIAKFKGKDHHTISRRQQQQHQVSTKYDKYSCLRMPNSSPVPVAAASSYRQMRNASPTGSSSIGSPAGSSSRSLHGAAEAICSVCGDGHAKLHYGVIACYGCKGFFRRTLTGKYRYACRFGGHCVVDKFQRNSCRFCRFNRCLEVGMDPKAVRPDRDLTGKQKVPRVRKRAMDEELINHMMRLQGDDWSRKIPVEAKMLLMQLLNVESKVAKGDTSLQDTSLPSQHSLPMTEACLYGSAGSYSGQQRNVSLKELFEQKPSNTRRTEMCYEPMRMARAEELPRIAHRGAIAAVDWVESLAEMIDCALLDTADKISLVKACYAPLTIFNFSARTAQNTSDPDILCLCSYSFVPRKLPSDFNGSNHLSNNLIDRTLNELVAPLRKLALKEEEVVALKAIICLDPNAKALSQEAERGVAELRDRVQDMLFQVVKELHPTQNAAAVFGNLLLLLPTIATLSGLMCENMQFCQVFGWTDPLLNELFEAADEGHLEGEERKFALFGGEGSASAGAISYSPPMLGDSLHCGNPAEISLYPQQQMSPNSPPRHLASTPSRASSSLSSSQSPNSSSLSPSLSRPAGPSVEKCEMGTQTDAFEQSISSTMEGGGCEFDTAANSSSRVLLYSQQYSAEHSPFQNIFLGEDHNPHQHPNNDEFHTMDSLLFDTTASSTADFFGLMR